LKFVRKNHF